MRRQIESIILENTSDQRLRIYKVEGDGTPIFCIGVEGDETHFEFIASKAKTITEAINSVVAEFV